MTTMAHHLQPLREVRARRTSAGTSDADGKVATITLDRPGEEESADVRLVCGAARPVPRAGVCERREGRRRHRRRRQLLLGRRRARDHRPADEDDDAGAARVHADDRRPRQGDARVPAADRRRRRRHLRGRGRDGRARIRFPLRHAGGARPRSCSSRVGLAGCDMGACTLLPRMIGQGRAAELLYTGRVMTADEGAAWGFFNRLVASGCARRRRARACARAGRRPDVRARR